MSQDKVDEIFLNVQKKISKGVCEVIDQWAADEGIPAGNKDLLKQRVDAWLMRNFEGKS